MSNIKAGDKVSPHDGSWNMLITNGKIVVDLGSNTCHEDWIVLMTGVSIPSCGPTKINDTIIQSCNDKRIVFIQERFLTKVENDYIAALRLTIDLWSHLEKTGNEYKNDYPEYESKIKHLIEGCPLCDFHFEDEKLNCNKCILKKAFGNSCFDLKSPFQRWNHSLTKSDRALHAGYIKQACETELKRKLEANDNSN